MPAKYGILTPMINVTIKAVLLALVFAAQAEPKLNWLDFEAPEYPQKAQAAHIDGPVSLTFVIRAKGPAVVEKATGNPILIAAAEESLKKSMLGCSFCDNQVPRFTVLFDFQMVERDCNDPDSAAPTSIRSESTTHIVITAQIPCPADKAKSDTGAKKAKNKKDH